MLTLGMKPTGTSSVELAKIPQMDFGNRSKKLRASNRINDFQIDHRVHHEG
jgi:hypothetical protein